MAVDSRILSFVDGEYTYDTIQRDGSIEVGKVDPETVSGIEGRPVDRETAVERLEAIAGVYRQRQREISRAVTADTGYPITDAEALVDVAISFLLDVDRQFEAVFGESFEAPFDRHVRYDRTAHLEPTPKGDVLVITPGNATVPLAPLTAASALVTGNTVTVRPSSSATRSVYEVLKPFCERFSESVNLAFADAAEVVDPDVFEAFDVVHYTGSSRFYESVTGAAATAGIDSYVEGEGSGVFVVDGRVDAAAGTFARAITRCNGKLCTTPSGVLVDEAVADEFRARLEDELDAVTVGDPTERTTDVAPDPSIVVPGGSPEPIVDPDCPVEIYPYAESTAGTEVYGPGAWLREFEDHETVREFLRSRRHGLTTTVFSRNPENVLYGPDDRRAVSSRVCVNADPTLQSAHSPWGAMGASGDSPGTTRMEKFTRDVVTVEEGADATARRSGTPGETSAQSAAEPGSTACESDAGSDEDDGTAGDAGIADGGSVDPAGVASERTDDGTGVEADDARSSVEAGDAWASVEADAAPESIRAMVLDAPGDVSVETFESRSFDGLTVENRWSGVCGTDVGIYRGDIEAAHPLVPGHENVGVVTDGTATDVTGRPVEPGDEVLWTGIVPCDDCRPCREGRPNNCLHRTINGVTRTAEISPHVFGGWAERSYVDRKTMMVKLTDAEAADPTTVLTEPMATVVGIDLPPGDVLVVGAGTLGALWTLRAAEMDDRSVSVVAGPDKRERLDPHVDAFYDRTADDVPRHAFDAVVNATGRANVFGSAIEYARAGGTVVEASVLGEDELTVDVSDFVNKSLTVTGKLGYTRDDLVAAHDFVTERRERLTPFVDTYDVEAVEAAFDAPHKAVLDVANWV